jgi:hypothetical protein
MPWDSSFLNTADPDQLATMTLDIHCDPDFPMPFAVVGCAADLPIDVRVFYADPDPQFPAMNSFQLKFTGKCMDLQIFAMNVNNWSPKTITVLDGRENDHGRNAATTPEGSSGVPEEPQ